MIEKIFQITNFLDSARWEIKKNYNLINFYKDGLSDDTKILTHWLCYISDRQMGFKRVWDVGGFVFSEFVDEIKITKSFDLLNPDRNKSFFIRRQDYKDKKGSNFKEEDKEKYLFVSQREAKNNRILQSYEFEENDIPYFISRYYPSDYLSILYTLHILKGYDFNLTKYIIKLLDILDNDSQLISKLLFGLYLLTYDNIGQPNALDLNFAKNLQAAKGRTEKVEKIIADRKLFEKEFTSFKKSKIFKQKRAWCALRDFLKSPEFSKYFFSSLEENGFKKVADLKSKSLLTQLELPGDVWNNNLKFRNCILKGTRYKKDKLPFPKLLRKIYDEEKIKASYPEQFDITFDFVPRMCENNNCSICIYGINQGKGKELNKICIKDTTKYCPVALISCNYKSKCKGENCHILQFLK